MYCEIRQIKENYDKYFTSFWNVLDFFSIVGIPLVLTLDLLHVDATMIRPLTAVTILIMYLRLFYYLRMFDSRLPITKIIIDITLDIQFFLFVMIIMILGCQMSFYVLSKNTVSGKEGECFLQYMIYSYKLALEDFAMSDKYETMKDSFLVWSIFVFGTMFVCIILLNMMIAIMSESFAKIGEAFTYLANSSLRSFKRPCTG